MIRAALSALRSPFYRRETWNYARWVLRHGFAWPAAKQFARGLREMRATIGSSKGGTDPGLNLRRHRFEWAERSPLESEAECMFLVESILGWIDKHPCKENAEGWDAYSASRRASNWVIMLAVLKGFVEDFAPIRKINKSLAEHANFICDHMEDRGAATNNHIISNAASLYLMGVHFRSKSMCHAGRTIIEDTIIDMFTTDGFLREGSSHYHMLYCQRFIEILSAAKDAKDESFAETLTAHLAKMLACADLLCENDPMPLIGDVSPDLDPSYTLAHVGKFNGPSAYLRQTRTACFVESGYYRFRNEHWALFIYVNPLGYVPAGSHGHDDLLGFTLYHNGKPVLVDMGRTTYAGDPMGRHGRSVRAHNGIAINGLGPSVVHAHNAHLPLMMPLYYDWPPIVKATTEGDFVCVSIRHLGFNRIRHGLFVTRHIFLGLDRVVIEDDIEGKGRHGLEWFFHFHPSTSAEGDGFRLEAESASSIEREIFHGAKGRNPIGWFSARYGNAVPTDTAVFQECARLPVKRRFTLIREG